MSGAALSTAASQAAMKWASDARGMSPADLYRNHDLLVGMAGALDDLHRLGLTEENLAAMLQGVANSLHAILEEMQSRGLGDTVRVAAAAH